MARVPVMGDRLCGGCVMCDVSERIYVNDMNAYANPRRSNNAISMVCLYRLMGNRSDVSFQVGGGVGQVLVVLEGFL